MFKFHWVFHMINILLNNLFSAYLLNKYQTHYCIPIVKTFGTDANRELGTKSGMQMKWGHLRLR